MPRYFIPRFILISIFIIAYVIIILWLKKEYTKERFKQVLPYIIPGVTVLLALLIAVIIIIHSPIPDYCKSLSNFDVWMIPEECKKYSSYIRKSSYIHFAISICMVIYGLTRIKNIKNIIIKILYIIGIALVGIMCNLTQTVLLYLLLK